jgi:hypothetical protein
MSNKYDAGVFGTRKYKDYNSLDNIFAAAQFVLQLLFQQTVSPPELT